MKKLISLLMAMAVILSAALSSGICTSAEMLDGEDGIDYVEALYFETPPTIDGYISEAEWGRATVHMQYDWCATGDDAQPYYNSFFYWKSGTLDSNPMEYDLWLRWDENNYYVGVKVRDYDAHSLKHSRNDMWNGDAINFRVDYQGPNAATGGDRYDPNIGTPWSDDRSVPNFYVGYSQIAGGYIECHENTNGIGLTEKSDPVFGAVDVAVAPSEKNSDNPIGYHDDAANGYTTYEIAIPWKYIFENELVRYAGQLTEQEKAPYVLDYSEYSPRRNPYGGIGYSLGMSLTVYNAQSNSNSYSAFMSWGSGTTSIQTWEYYYTCAGSNCVTLSEEKVVPGTYDKYDPSKLEAGVAEKEYDQVFYDYLGGDTSRSEAVAYDELSTLTYDSDDDMDLWGSAEFFGGSTMDVGGEHGKVLSYDRVIETHTDDDGKVHEAGVDPIDQFYIDTRYNEWGDGRTYPVSYTFEFDIMYTGNEIVQEGRYSELGNWFGGVNSVSYYCGYSFTDRAFIISEVMNPYDLIASRDYELEANTWYNWKFQYDNDTCTVRLFINDELIFNVYNRYFYYANDQYLEDGAMMVFWFINTQMKMDNVKIYNFYDYLSAPVEENHTVSGTVNSFGEEDDVNVHLIDMSTGEASQIVTIKGNSAEYKFEDVADGTYLVYYEKYKHVSSFAQLYVDGEDVVMDEVTLYPIGDADNDGVVTASDIVEVIKAMKDSDLQTVYHDVDGDLVITASDITSMISIMKGRFDFPPIGIDE